MFVCRLALATLSVLSPILPSFLFPQTRPCALTVNVEPGSTDAGSFIPSRRRVHYGWDMET